ncbi:MAG: Gldg family protein [Waterburya sp.]
MTKIILFFLGISLCVAGIVAASIIENWSAMPIILLISGVFLLLSGLWLWGNKYKFWQLRSTKQGAGAIAKITAVLIIIAMLNWVGIRYGKRWDFTENKLYTLSQQSQVMVAKLEQPLEVLVFNRNNNSELENLLQNYRRYSDQFQFKFIDPEQQIGLAQQFGVQSLGEVYLQYGDKRQKLDTVNAALGETLSETRLTNGIEKIKRDRSINIYFLQGHGEAPLDLVEGGLAQAVKNLEDKGNTVQPLNLASSGKMPDDANLIIIAGATRKLLLAEVSTLQQYLQAGGSLLLLLSPNIDIGITPILQNWGIELDERLIVDGSGAGNVMGFGPAVAIVNRYGEHPITASFRNGISLFPEARPIKSVEKAGIISTPLASTNQQTWAESDLQVEQITFDATKDILGPLNIAIASSRDQAKASRMVVFGSTTFATNGWFEQQLNGDMLLNSISWLVGEDQDTLSIRPKEVANRRINLSSLQTGILSWLALRIMPFMALVTGVYLWWQRR